MTHDILRKDFELAREDYKIQRHIDESCGCCDCACANILAGTWEFKIVEWNWTTVTNWNALVDVMTAIFITDTAEVVTYGGFLALKAETYVDPSTSGNLHYLCTTKSGGRKEIEVSIDGSSGPCHVHVMEEGFYGSPGGNVDVFAPAYTGSILYRDPLTSSSDLEYLDEEIYCGTSSTFYRAQFYKCIFAGDVEFFLGRSKIGASVNTIEGGISQKVPTGGTYSAWDKNDSFSPWTNAPVNGPWPSWDDATFPLRLNMYCSISWDNRNGGALAYTFYARIYYRHLGTDYSLATWSAIGTIANPTEITSFPYDNTVTITNSYVEDDGTPHIDTYSEDLSIEEYYP